MCKKIKMIFDASILANGAKKDSCRSGIYFTVFNVFSQLLQKDNVVISLYCQPKSYNDLITVLNTYFPDYKFVIISDYFARLYKQLEKKKSKLKENHHYVQKNLLQIAILSLWPWLKILSSICNIYNSYKINQNDVYLSLQAKKPKGIKIKSFTMLHDLILFLFPEYHCQSFKKGDWFYDLCQSLNDKDYYFANSEYTRQDFLKYYPIIDEKKIFTTHLACNETFKPCSFVFIEKVKTKYNIPQDKKYIFSLCTLEPRKNLERAVKTFIEFIKKNNIDDLVFVLGGGHWEMFIEKLEQEIANLKDYSDKIVKIGYVDDEDLPALYSGAEWFTYTSMYEGFGLPPLEAMSCGCPVITSNNSSLPEVVGDAGIMIDYDSDEQHIQAYERYYFDKNLRNEYAQKGIERAKQFSWQKCTNKILDVINKYGV